MAQINIKRVHIETMRHHIRCFRSEAEFTQYENSDDRWKPLVAFVPTTPVSDVSFINENTPGRVVFQRLGEKFFEVLNGGTGYFNCAWCLDFPWRVVGVQEPKK